MNTCGYIALPVKLTKRREVTANAVIRKGELHVIEIFPLLICSRMFNQEPLQFWFDSITGAGQINTIVVAKMITSKIVIIV